MTDDDTTASDPWNDDEHPNLHYIVGEHNGREEAVREARVAHSMGEIDLWLDLNQARTSEDWDAWQAEHGTITDLTERWAEKSSKED